MIDEHADLGEADQEHEHGGWPAAVLLHVAQLGGALLAPGRHGNAHRGLVDGGPGPVTHPGLPEPPGHLLREDGQLLQRQPPVQVTLRPGQQKSATERKLNYAHFMISLLSRLTIGEDLFSRKETQRNTAKTFI